MDALPASALGATASVPVSVLPSPVFISAIEPACSTMPPISWTSKWRMPIVRRGDLADDRERLGQEVGERFPVPGALTQGGGLLAQLIVLQEEPARAPTG